MASTKNNKQIINVNPNLNISCVHSSKAPEYAELGYQYLMIKMSDDSILKGLNSTSRQCLKLLAADHSLKSIAMELPVSEKQIYNILKKLRTKFHCATNHGLASFINQSGLLPFL